MYEDSRELDIESILFILDDGEKISIPYSKIPYLNVYAWTHFENDKINDYSQYNLITGLEIVCLHLDYGKEDLEIYDKLSNCSIKKFIFNYYDGRTIYYLIDDVEEYEFDSQRNSYSDIDLIVKKKGFPKINEDFYINQDFARNYYASVYYSNK